MEVFYYLIFEHNLTEVLFVYHLDSFFFATIVKTFEYLAKSIIKKETENYIIHIYGGEAPISEACTNCEGVSPKRQTVCAGLKSGSLPELRLAILLHESKMASSLFL